MTLLEALKLVHVSCAFVSVSGFALRAYWMVTGSSLLRRRLTRVLPHTIDTLLLASALWMLYLWGVSPLAFTWLSAKLVALLFYIILGMIALRFGRSRRQRSGAALLALGTAGYMLSVAYTKSPYGPLVLLGAATG